MDVRRNALLAEIAREAAIERSDFLVRAGDQLERFMASHRDRIFELGGLVLIDDDPDYLAVAPDGTFRSRSRVFDDATGEWVSETEIVETAAELIELYNPADLYEAFADAIDQGEAPAAVADATEGTDPYAGAADSWAAGEDAAAPTDDASAARTLYDLALDFQERSQASEARMIDQFEEAAARLADKLGDFVIVDDDDERLVYTAGGTFRAEVIPDDDTGEWKQLVAPEDIVAYYDPTDVFGDLADALAEAFPGIAPEMEGEEGEEVEEVEESEAEGEDRS